ncbi:MAG TPA: hypothetical protein VGE05_02660 [Novosphingobium sp.]
MPPFKKNNPHRAARREAIERIIARYPAIAEDELHSVFTFFRHEATHGDRRRIKGNAAIAPQYRRICADHSLDRLRRVERSILAVLTLPLAIGALLLVAGLWSW